MYKELMTYYQTNWDCEPKVKNNALSCKHQTFLLFYIKYL